MLTIAELPEFIRISNKLLTETERQDIIRYLAEHPKAGDLMEGTGGVRKLRWARGGQGKSGGVRVIYYWLKDDGQIYMLVVYPKSAKDNLTDRETAILRDLVKELCHG